MPARVWQALAGIIILLLIAVIGLDQWQARGGEASLFGSDLFGRAARGPAVPTAPATLARALLDGRLVPGFAPRGDPLVLASSTVFLPTRRAVRALASAILEEAGGEATALPRIIPLGDVDEDALAFAEDAPVSGVPAADPLTRKLVLARLVHAWAALLPAATGDEARLIASSPTAAVALADSLARLFDDLIIAGVSFDGKHVWFASGSRLNSFDPKSGKKLRALDVAGHAGTAFDGEHLFQIAENRIQKIDPETGHPYDDTKRYIDQLPLSAADKAKIFEGNARRVYARLSRVIEKEAATAL